MASWHRPKHLTIARTKRRLLNAARQYAFVAETQGKADDWCVHSTEYYRNACIGLGVPLHEINDIMLAGLEEGYKSAVEVMPTSLTKDVPMLPIGPQRRCSACGLTGHNIKTCKNKLAMPPKDD